MTSWEIHSTCADSSWITLKGVSIYIILKTVQLNLYTHWFCRVCRTGSCLCDFFFTSKFNNDIKVTFTPKWAGHQTDNTQRLNEFAKMVENALTMIPYKTKQLTFKMKAVNTTPFPDAISLYCLNLICKWITFLWISSNERMSGLRFKSMKKPDPSHQTLWPAGSLDGDEQQEQVCTLKIQDVKNLQNTYQAASMENVLQFKLFPSKEPHVDLTRNPCFREKSLLGATSKSMC